MEEWDNSGFILGDEEKTVSTVVMALDGTKAAADYAKSVEADLLLTHHPIIFNPVKKIVKARRFMNLLITILRRCVLILRMIRPQAVLMIILQSCLI